MKGYNGACHKSFPSLREAQEFMYFNRTFPQVAHTLTQLPPPNINPQYNLVDMEMEMKMSRMVVVAPHDIPRDQFLPIKQMANRIAAEPSNRVLDPPSFECESKHCNFCTGDLMAQRFSCLLRLYQLNSVLCPSPHHYMH